MLAAVDKKQLPICDGTGLAPQEGVGIVRGSLLSIVLQGGPFSSGDKKKNIPSLPGLRSSP